VTLFELCVHGLTDPVLFGRSVDRSDDRSAGPYTH